MNCKICGSHAINPHIYLRTSLHENRLCDVHLFSSRCDDLMHENIELKAQLANAIKVADEIAKESIS